jgi:hypothetical protein
VSERQTRWADLIPDSQWRIYRSVIAGAQKLEIPFALGGAFAVATYTGYWRNTKDLDLYVLPQYRERMIQVMNKVGLRDYHDEKPYDRWWIYRAHSGHTIVDIIWAMANHRAQIDELWMSGPEVELRGFVLKVLPPEALLWDKLYIMQRDRCDWPDVLNLLYMVGREIHWEYVIERMGTDTALLAGILAVFAWIAPGHARKLPGWLWGRLGVTPPPAAAVADIEKPHVDLLDRRPWFGPDRKKLQDAA